MRRRRARLGLGASFADSSPASRAPCEFVLARVGAWTLQQGEGPLLRRVVPGAVRELAEGLEAHGAVRDVRRVRGRRRFEEEEALAGPERSPAADAVREGRADV